MLNRCLSPILFVLTLPLAAQQPARQAPYQDPATPTPKRVADLLARMTLEEKISMLAGSGWMESTGVPRLGIPQIKMADGPMGIRLWTGSSAVTSVEGMVHTFSATAFPAGIDIAASFDPALAHEEGAAIGEEVASIGRDMILGPTVNIQRTPLWGRNFESYGEDPFLTGKLAVGYITGVQSQGIIPSVKHFTVNNEEFERHRIDVAVDERSLHELYFPAFEAAIRDAHVWSVMSSYNKVNGTYAAQSPLLEQELYRDNHFSGFVISDWGSTYSTAPTVNAGMDLEMPGGPPMQKWLARPATHEAGNDGGMLTPGKILSATQSGEIPLANIDRNVSRILTILFTSGLFDHPHPGGLPIDTPAQRATARKAADEGMVLLKNDASLLPLDPTKLRSLAVIGPNAATARIGGGGSGLVFAKNIVSPLEGLQTRAPGLKVTYALGVGMPGENPAQDTPEARRNSLNEAVAAAKSSDVALVFAGYSSKFETEGKDRPNMDLPDGQDELIQAVVAANPKTIVILNSGDPVDLTRWIDRVPALLEAWYPGEEAGNAIADLLFGDQNPSGHLPFTFIRKLADSPSSTNYPGTNLHVTYAEGIYVGYRYFDKHPEVAPLYPFGFGLSYTTFAFSNLKLPQHFPSTGTAAAQVTVRNTGTRKGATVVQLYLGDPHSSIDRPVRELKGFERIELAPGEQKTVTLPIDRRALSFWSPTQHTWLAEPGPYIVSAGSDSRTLPLQTTITLDR